MTSKVNFPNPQLNALQDPDEVGQSEYRILYELLGDVLSDEEQYKQEEHTNVAISLLDEVIEQAQHLITQLSPPQETEIHHLKQIIADLLDGQCDPGEIHRNTGIRMERCQEIAETGNKILNELYS